MLSHVYRFVIGRGRHEEYLYKGMAGCLIAGIIMLYEPALIQENIAPYAIAEQDMPFMNSCLNSRKKYGFEFASHDLYGFQSSIGSIGSEQICACITKHATSKYKGSSLKQYELALEGVVRADATDELKRVFVNDIPAVLVQTHDLQTNVENTYRYCYMRKTHKAENISRIANLKSRQMR